MADSVPATAPRRSSRPTAADLAAARDLTIPDVVAPGLRVLFSGINPGLYSAATGYHFARPGNRFWPTLHRSGFTPRQLRPDEQEQLLALGLGITNIAARATARADELTTDELQEGGQVLRAKAARLRPRWLAVVGVTAYRTAFGDARAAVGPQERTLAATRLWVLPNPSGLNASWTTPRLAEAFHELREAVRVAGDDPSSPTPPGESLYIRHRQRGHLKRARTVLTRSGVSVLGFSHLAVRRWPASHCFPALGLLGSVALVCGFLARLRHSHGAGTTDTKLP